MKKDSIIIIVIILLGTLMYGLTLRGATGNPTAETVDSFPTSAFESSHEKGPYGHVVSLAERGNYALTQPWADLASPDVGTLNGKYYAFFAPGVSYLTLPFYLVGTHFGFAQVATFSAESLVSIITLVFIFLIGRRIFQLPRWAAFFSVLVFGFASTSWSYAVTLYQNAFSTCFIITGFYAAWRFSKNDSKHSWIYAAYVWLAYALAIMVDYPNAVLMLPVMIYLAVSTFSFKKVEEGIVFSVRWAAIVTFLSFAFVTSLHFWHNTTYYGGWNHLAGELHGYKPELPISTSTTTSSGLSLAPATTTAALNSAGIVTPENKTAVGFFHERVMPNGFHVLLFSDERGLFYFTPIFLFSLIGIWCAFRKRKEEPERHSGVYVVPVALIAVNIFLYSAWGDPWGGWAYGPRYIVPTMACLALFAGVALYEVRKRFWLKLLGLILFLYSSAIALLGALTTNMIPTKGAVVLLPVKKYNFLLNLDYLKDGKSGSFLYKTYFSNHLTLLEYFLAIYCVIIVLALIILFTSHKNNHE